jgi:hypothetical protein
VHGVSALKIGIAWCMDLVMHAEYWCVTQKLCALDIGCNTKVVCTDIGARCRSCVHWILVHGVEVVCIGCWCMVQVASCAH